MSMKIYFLEINIFRHIFLMLLNAHLNNLITTTLTSRTGSMNREFPEKLVLNPLARLPIAWIASTATAIFTSVISCGEEG